MTGGFSVDGDGEHTAEVWLPNGRTCSMPNMSPGRRYHSQSSLTACGGTADTETSTIDYVKQCHTFTAGEWEVSHSLDGTIHYGRNSSRKEFVRIIFDNQSKLFYVGQIHGHVSWQSPDGIYLLHREKTVLLSYTNNTVTTGWDYPHYVK